MKEIQDYIPITKAKNILLEIIRKIEKDDDTIAITKKGVPIAVILSMEKYKGLLETLDILSDPDAMASLRKSIQEAKRKEWVPYEEVFGK
ncbi:MAG: type II toxin-antitoxin system Phd/YefM family antitoxin [Deltaproteobacteria bacterium]|nr:type II toxin-antitoxin system Phd/YefM family antitoxin [Deltaproteobacteria bacterium]